jgi:hypothetical protein
MAEVMRGSVKVPDIESHLLDIGPDRVGLKMFTVVFTVIACSETSDREILPTVTTGSFREARNIRQLG